MIRIKKAPLTGSIVCPRVLSPYDEMLLKMVQDLGGFNNGHAHLDRADTLDPKYLAHINLNPFEAAALPLKAKQNLTGYLHTGVAYTEENLRQRMSNVIERLIAYGTTRLATCIDATPDIAENGQLAFRVAMELREKYADRIRIELGPHPIFGFKEGTGRWEAFEQAAQNADFLSALPEKDDFSNSHNRDGRVGFKKHIRMVVELACKLGKEVHLHLDQANDPNENGTEILLEGLDWVDQPKISNHEGPTVWVVHMISPTGYSEERFYKLLQLLLKFNVGVLFCPQAGVSMRQLRPVLSPTHSSMARVLELGKMRVPMQAGSDNICDMYVAGCSGDMLTETIVGGHAIRFAHPHVWAKIMAGVPLNDIDRTALGSTIYQDSKVFLERNSNWTGAVA